MAKITLDDSPVVVEIPPISLNGVVLNRIASPHSVPLETVAKRIVMNVQVSFVGDNNEVINRPDLGIQPYIRMLVADNSTLCDNNTGLPFCMASEEYITDGEGNQILNPLLEDKDYVPQYQWFREKMKTASIVDDLIIGNIQWAAAMGKLD